MPPGAAHVVYVTSPLAHAELAEIDTAAAALVPGVLGVYTAADVDLDEYPQQFAGMNGDMRRPILARERVRFVGEPIAAVVATTIAAAADAAALVDLDLRPLPVFVDPEQSHDAGAALFPGIADPLAFRTGLGEPRHRDRPRRRGPPAAWSTSG